MHSQSLLEEEEDAYYEDYNRTKETQHTGFIQSLELLKPSFNPKLHKIQFFVTLDILVKVRDFTEASQQRFCDSFFDTTHTYFGRQNIVIRRRCNLDTKEVKYTIVQIKNGRKGYHISRNAHPFTIKETDYDGTFQIIYHNVEYTVCRICSYTFHRCVYVEMPGMQIDIVNSEPPYVTVSVRLSQENTFRKVCESFPSHFVPCPTKFMEQLRIQNYFLYCMVFEEYDIGTHTILENKIKFSKVIHRDRERCNRWILLHRTLLH